MKKPFCTVLHSLKSPQNVGMIIRSHVAHGGGNVIFTGNDLPWQFKKGSESFSRKLEKQVAIKHIPNARDAIDFLHQAGFSVVVIEIAETATSLLDFKFPDQVALLLGNEADGVPADIIAQADHVITIPQYGAVASLNVAVSASIAMYELMKGRKSRVVSGDEFV